MAFLGNSIALLIQSLDSSLIVQLIVRYWLTEFFRSFDLTQQMYKVELNVSSEPRDVLPFKVSSTGSIL